MKKKSPPKKQPHGVVVTDTNDFHVWLAEFHALNQAEQVKALGDLIGTILEDINPNPVVVMMLANDMMQAGLLNINLVTAVAGITEKLESLSADVKVSHGKVLQLPHGAGAGAPSGRGGTKVLLTPGEMYQVERAALATWKTIGDDCEKAAGKKLSKKATIEVVMDADHMAHFNGLYSHNWPEVYAKFKQLPYAAQVKLVRRGIFGE